MPKIANSKSNFLENCHKYKKLSAMEVSKNLIWFTNSFVWNFTTLFEKFKKIQNILPYIPAGVIKK